MPTFEIVSSQVRQLATDCFDSILLPIASGGFAKLCRLVYPPIMEQCINCQPNAIGNKPGTFYMHGGPVPFPIGAICPVCGGSSYKAQEVTEDIYLKTDVIEKNYYDTSTNVRLEDGLLEVRGYITDYPKIQQCNYMIHDVELLPYMEHKYELSKGPTAPFNIVPNRYFIATFKRVN